MRLFNEKNKMITQSLKDMAKEQEDLCPKCGNKTSEEMVGCLCDKDWCVGGSRCGGNEIVDHYHCKKCGWRSERTERAKAYWNKHVPSSSHQF